MRWESNCKKLFEQLISNVELQVRDIAKKFVGLQAIENATDRGSMQVEEEDMIKAFLSVTPESEQEDMKKTLIEFGIELSKYQVKSR